MSSGRVAIMAIGAYSERKMLEMKTIDASPGSPINENRGRRYMER